MTRCATHCVRDLCHWVEDRGWLQSERGACSHARYLEMVPVQGDVQVLPPAPEQSAPSGMQSGCWRGAQPVVVLTLAELPLLLLPGGVKVEHRLQRTPPVKHVTAPARTIWFKPSDNLRRQNHLVLTYSWYLCMHSSSGLSMYPA